MVTAFGWHSIFVIPTVAMVVLIGCCFAFVRNLENTPAKLDVPSVALSALGLTAFVYGVSEVTANVTLAVGVLAIAVAAIAAFAWRQFHCDHPLIELSPLKNARFVMPLLLVMMAMTTTFSMSVLLPLYFEGALGMTALVAGVVMLAPVLTNAFATLFGGRVMDKRGEWPLLPAGFVCIVVGLALMVALSATMSPPGVFVGAVLVYVGVGLVLSPSQTAGLKNLPPRQNPSGVTLMTTCLQIAACIGPSLFVGVMNSAQAGALANGAEAAASTALGFSSALLVAAVIAAVGLVVAFLFARPGAQEKAARTMSGTTRAMGDVPREAGDTTRAMGSAAGGAARAMSDAAGDAVGATGPAVGATSPAASAAASGAAAQGAPMGASAVREEEQPAGVHASSVTLAAVMETDPYTLPATARVEEAIRLLMDRKVSGMPVVDEAGRAVGFISDGDIMRYLADRHPLVTSAYSVIMLANEGSFDERLRELIALPVSAIATEGVVGVPVDASLEEACNLLAQHKLKKVPVLEAGRVVGTVNRSDVLRYAMGSLVGAPA
ncbi:MAG TPA: MFS transporter [Candidatus Aveggerthella excrementigallinarum]|nr:MFS transporter [Candidatus Aveggerthella excrementigallinarum]